MRLTLTTVITWDVTFLFRSHVPPIYHCTTTWIPLWNILLSSFSRHITVTHAYMVSLFLLYGSPCILHVLLFHVTVFMLYDCFLSLIWIFPLLDMRAVDMWYVESHIYCSRFSLYCSRFLLYCFMLSTELRSSYHVTRIMYCILDISYHKENLGMGETWRLTRSYRVDVWIHCLSHCRGRGSAGYRLL